MFPGPTLADLTGSLAVGARVSVHRGRTTLVEDLPVEDVKLEATDRRSVRRQLTVTTTSDFVPSAPLDPVNNYGHRLHAWQVLENPQGRRWEIDLGWFHIEWWGEKQATGRMEIRAVDLTRLIETDEMAWPSSPPKNQRLQAELQRLAGSQVPIILDSKSNPLVDQTLQFQTDRMANLADLCAAHGLDMGMKPDGYLHFWPYTDQVVATYTAKDLIVDGSRESQERKANRYLAVGSKTEGSGDKAKETRWSFEAKLTAPPFDADYGIVRERIEVQSATSQAMVTKAANDAQRKGAAVLGFRSFLIAPDLRLECGDVAMFIPEDGPVKGRVTAFSAPVTGTGEQRVDIEIIG